MTRTLLAALVLLLPLAAAAAGFIQGIEDLPLMPELQADPQSNVAFDSPQGRIVVAYARGAVTPGAVEGFYARTLPQLGWERIGDALFRREGELLKIEVGAGSAPGQPLTVSFTLSPQGRK